MSRTFRTHLATFVSLPVALLVGCSGGDHAPSASGDFSDPTHASTTDEGPCIEGSVKKCGVTLRTHDGVADCFQGEQVCHDGVMSECGATGATTTKSIPFSPASGDSVSVQGLGAAGKCATNPCDPYCSTFVDTPAGTLDAGADGLVYSDGGGITVPVTPSTGGDGGASPGSLDADEFGKKANYGGACTSSADCNVDQHCVIPPGATTGTCVSWKSGEFDDKCSGPGDQFGGVKPSLLCNFVDPSDKYGEYAGTVVVGQFDLKSGAPAGVVGIAEASDYLIKATSTTVHDRFTGKIKILNAKACALDVSIPNAAGLPADPDGATPYTGLGKPVAFNEQSTPLLVDLNRDGVPEVVALAIWGQNSVTFYQRLMAYTISVSAAGVYSATPYAGWVDPDGRVGRGWTMADAGWAVPSKGAMLPLGYWDSSGPSAVDLDDDGRPEIIVDGYVFNYQGLLIGMRPDVASKGPEGVAEYWGQNAVVGDFDLDGKVEYMERQGLFEAGSFGYTSSVLTSMVWNADSGFSFPSYKACKTAGYSYRTSAPLAGSCVKCANSYQTFQTSGADSGNCDGCNTAGGYAQATAGKNAGACVAACASPKVYQSSGPDDGVCVNVSACTTSGGVYWLDGAVAANLGKCVTCTAGALDTTPADSTYGGCVGCAAGYTKALTGKNAAPTAKCYATCASGYVYEGTPGAALDGYCVAASGSSPSCGGSKQYLLDTGHCYTCAAGSTIAMVSGAAKCVKGATITAPTDNGTIPNSGARGTQNFVTAATASTTVLAKSTPATAAYSVAPAVAVPSSTDYPSHAVSYSSRDFQAFADFGDFGGAAAKDKPEMVWVSEDSIEVMAIDGTPVLGFAPSYVDSASVSWFLNKTSPPAGSDKFVSVPGGGGGGVTIADYDGDGLPEFGVAGASYYVVFDLDCVSPRSYKGKTGTCARTTTTACDCGVCSTGSPVLWCRGTQDQSSFITGSSVFDFNADGKAEVVYGDECWLRVYDGSSGNVYFSAKHSSQTKLEEPIVADVNADGRADLLMTSTRAGESVAGEGLKCPSACASGTGWADTYDSTGNTCYHCENGSGVATNPVGYACLTGFSLSTYVLVTETVKFGGTVQAGWLADKNFAGLRCTTAADCPSAGMACTANLCRCTTATFSPTSDPQCGSDFACMDPPSGVTGGKTCRALRCTGAGCGVSGVQVYTGPGSGWAKSRAVWNEQAYTPVMVNDDSSVKKTSTMTADETLAWTPANAPGNSFRQQLQKPGDAAFSLPDLTVQYPCTVDYLPICNRGSADAPAGVVVAGFPGGSASFDGSTDKTITVGPCTTTTVIKPGQCIDLYCKGAGKGTDEYMINPACTGPTCASDVDCKTGTCDLTTKHCTATCKNGLTSAPAIPECKPGSGSWSFAHGSTTAGVCGGGGAVSSSVFTRVFTAPACPTGTRLQWGLFSYDTTDPSGTNVTFDFTTGTSSTSVGASVGLAVAGYTVNTTTVRDPAICKLPSQSTSTLTCPIDVAAKLAAAGQKSNQPVLVMKATLNPNTTTLVAPVLNEWNVTYDCIPNE